MHRSDPELPQAAPRAGRWRVAAPWLGLVLLSAVLHLWGLGERTMHHDEAIHASLAANLAEHGSYRYDPTYHGPLLYSLDALTQLLLPATIISNRELVARLPVALCGIAMLWIAWSLRRHLGQRAAWWTGLLLTISPVLLYFGRFLRMDLPEMLCASAALLAWREVRRRGRAWISLGLWSGLALATKENAYVTMALVAVVVLLLSLRPGLQQRLRRAGSWLHSESRGLLTAVLCFLGVVILLYTVGLRYLEDLAFPVRAVSYWWQQHLLQRVAGPWWFHLPRLAQYELLILGAATVWVIRRRRRLWPIERFLFLLGLCSIAMYAYLGEKVPWLLVHQVWPFVPLAGAQLARSFGPAGRWWSRLIAGTGLALTTVMALTCSFVLDEISPGQARVESLHYVQSSPEIKPLIREGRALLAGQQSAGAVVVNGAAAWPLCWYWRGLPVRWTTPEPGSSPQLVVCDPIAVMPLLEDLDGDYSRERIPLRSWWLLSQRAPSAREILRYALTRRPWGVIGSTDIVILRKVNHP